MYYILAWETQWLLLSISCKSGKDSLLLQGRVVELGGGGGGEASLTRYYQCSDVHCEVLLACNRISPWKPCDIAIAALLASVCSPAKKNLTEPCSSGCPPSKSTTELFPPPHPPPPPPISHRREVVLMDTCICAPDSGVDRTIVHRRMVPTSAFKGKSGPLVDRTPSWILQR